MPGRHASTGPLPWPLLAGNFGNFTRQSKIDGSLAAFAISGRRRPSAVRTHTLTPARCGDQWRARASADALSFAQNSTFRRARSSAHAVPPAHPHARFPPRPAQDVRTPAPHDSLAATPALFFQFFDDGGGTDMEHARGIPNATGIHRHVDDLLLSLGGVTGIAVIQQESASVAYRLLATITEFITVYGLWYAVPPLKGGTTYGQCTIHRCACPSHGVPGFDQPDTRRVS